MKKLSFLSTRRICASLLVALAFATGLGAHTLGTYQLQNLVTNSEGANVTDENLVNPWGLAFNPFGPAWVANNGSGVATVYDGVGTVNPLVVEIPTASEATGGSPTGVVYNGSPEFVINSSGAVGGTNGGTNGGTDGGTGPSRFIFATDEGVIAGWNPDVNATQAIRVNDASAANGAVYKGLAISANGTESRLYAADFFNNKVDVWDGNFQPVTLTEGAFTDPTLPAGYAPFNIQAINGSIYVAYAQQDEAKLDAVKGVGLGFVDVYDTDGQLIKRLISQGNLNAPWGMALAPAGFGEFGDRLLVGNFGDGTINAFDVATGGLIGQLADESDNPIVIDGLWGLSFGNGYLSQPVNTLFFTAGPNEEQDGLYGRIDTQGNVTPGNGGTDGGTNGGTNGGTDGGTDSGTDMGGAS